MASATKFDFKHVVLPGYTATANIVKNYFRFRCFRYYLELPTADDRLLQKKMGTAGWWLRSVRRFSVRHCLNLVLNPLTTELLELRLV
jgi:hypothetical protein